jgi:sugar phosphate isomerase/epimerase
MLEDVLLKETDPKLVTFEMDIYWVVRAGKDPVKLIQEHPDRFAMWHIKDMDKAKREINTEVGSGSIDFKKIFEYQKLSGVKHIYMEQENFSMDAYASITQSASYIKNTLLK